MPESTFVPPPRTLKRRLARWAVRTSALLLVVLVAAVVRLSVLQGRAERRLAEAEARLDAEDPGWRYEEIYASRPQPPADRDVIRVL